VSVGAGGRVAGGGQSAQTRNLPAAPPVGGDVETCAKAGACGFGRKQQLLWLSRAALLQFGGLPGWQRGAVRYFAANSNWVQQGLRVFSTSAP
jgi:hypothetical protein